MSAITLNNIHPYTPALYASSTKRPEPKPKPNTLSQISPSYSRDLGISKTQPVQSENKITVPIPTIQIASHLGQTRNSDALSWGILEAVLLESIELTEVEKRLSISESFFGNDSKDKEFLDKNDLLSQVPAKVESDSDTTSGAPSLERQMNDSRASSVSGSIVGHS